MRNEILTFFPKKYILTILFLEKTTMKSLGAKFPPVEAGVKD